jgi:peptide/nickel transport system ATP-binding protein
MAENPVLSLRTLSVSFLREGMWRPVVKDLSFNISSGETVAVVGESGSGKSVTALSIMRLLPSSNSRISGSIELNRRDILTFSETEMQSIRGDQAAMIFQEPLTSLNPSMPVGAQIAEAVRCHRNISSADAEAEALRLLDRVRIPAARARIKEYPHRFSGGMRQRVMIAMALACRPSLLIADEPTTALDVTVQAQIIALIKELQAEEKMAVLFITHDMGVVAEVADRTVVMLRGAMVESKPTDEIFRYADHSYTRMLIAAAPRLGTMTLNNKPTKFPIIDPSSGAITDAADVPDTVKADDPPVLEVKKLTTRFEIRSGLLNRLSGAVHAVQDVSFSIQPGETLSLVGESGCGKSSIGKSIVRLVDPASGSILVDGRDILQETGKALHAARQRVQMIFQDPFGSLNPRMTVGDAIAEPIIQNGIAPRARALEMTCELLERVGLDASLTRRFPHEFSGGQRQRICIARALGLSPKVLIADESVSALDSSIKAQVVNLMLELQASLGISYLFISHDMAVVERISHRVAVMYLGEIVEVGPRAEIFANPQHPYTQKLLAAVPLPDPSRRSKTYTVASDEITSPIREPGFVPPPRSYVEVGSGHFVQTA